LCTGDHCSTIGIRIDGVEINRHPPDVRPKPDENIPSDVLGNAKERVVSLTGDQSIQAGEAEGLLAKRKARAGGSVTGAGLRSY